MLAGPVPGKPWPAIATGVLYRMSLAGARALSAALIATDRLVRSKLE